MLAPLNSVGSEDALICLKGASAVDKRLFLGVNASFDQKELTDQDQHQLA
jgi:hypothetical protein